MVFGAEIHGIDRLELIEQRSLGNKIYCSIRRGFVFEACAMECGFWIVVCI